MSGLKLLQMTVLRTLSESRLQNEMRLSLLANMKRKTKQTNKNKTNKTNVSLIIIFFFFFNQQKGN